MGKSIRVSVREEAGDSIARMPDPRILNERQNQKANFRGRVVTIERAKRKIGKELRLRAKYVPCVIIF